MFNIVRDNIFEYDYNAIVNPVNCKGICGAGFAKIMREKYPNNYENYVNCCKQHMLKIGDVLTTIENDVFIFNLPTKDDYRNPSTYAMVFSGLQGLKIQLEKIENKELILVIPALGCGLGKLNFDIVSVGVEKILFPLFTKHRITLFEPL